MSHCSQCPSLLQSVDGLDRGSAPGECTYRFAVARFAAVGAGALESRRSAARKRLVVGSHLVRSVSLWKENECVRSLSAIFMGQSQETQKFIGRGGIAHESEHWKIGAAEFHFSARIEQRLLERI